MKKSLIKFLIIFFILISSCKNKNSSTEESTTYSSIKLIDYKVKFSFQKNKKNVTYIYKDSVYTVLIEYQSPHDSVSLEIFDDSKYPQRGIFFYKFADSQNNLLKKYQESIDVITIESFKNQNTFDTIYAYSSRMIPIMNLKFSRKGEAFINGIIHDFAYLKEEDSLKLRFLSNEMFVTHKFEVK